MSYSCITPFEGKLSLNLIYPVVVYSENVRYIPTNQSRSIAEKSDPGQNTTTEARNAKCCLHGTSVTAPYPDDQVHAVFDAGYFTLAPPTKVVPEVQQHPMWDLDST
jgi:hypothetical protein